jgi:hypothetical protein
VIHLYHTKTFAGVVRQTNIIASPRASGNICSPTPVRARTVALRGHRQHLFADAGARSRHRASRSPATSV